MIVFYVIIAIFFVATVSMIYEIINAPVYDPMYDAPELKEEDNNE